MTAVFCQLRAKFKDCIKEAGIKEEIKDNAVAPYEGCKLIIEFPEDATNKLILDIDCIIKETLKQVSGNRCDFLVIFEWEKQRFLFPIELKDSSVKISKVQRQLEGGIKFFKILYEEPFECFPVVVSRNLGRNSRNKFLETDIAGGRSKGIRKISHAFCGNILCCEQVIDDSN